MGLHAKVLETERLTLRRFGEGDAAFILRLVNDPAWLRYIGDRNVRTLEDARHYIESGPVEMYERLGFGLYLVEAKEGRDSVGICGFIKRESLEDVDLGFAFLPESRGRGYAFEAASAIMSYGANSLGFARVAAITSRDNHASARLLEKLGFHFERLARLAPGAEEVMVYASAVGTCNPCS